MRQCPFLIDDLKLWTNCVLLWTATAGQNRAAEGSILEMFSRICLHDCQWQKLMTSESIKGLFHFIGGDSNYYYLSLCSEGQGGTKGVVVKVGNGIETKILVLWPYRPWKHRGVQYHRHRGDTNREPRGNMQTLKRNAEKRGEPESPLGRGPRSMTGRATDSQVREGSKKGRQHRKTWEERRWRRGWGERGEEEGRKRGRGRGIHSLAAFRAQTQKQRVVGCGWYQELFGLSVEFSLAG